MTALTAAAPARDLCTDCGISRSSDPKRCGRACQFIRPDYPGLAFARTRVEMKALESVVHLRCKQPRRLRHMVPADLWKLVEPYGLKPRDDERPRP